MLIRIFAALLLIQHLSGAQTLSDARHLYFLAIEGDRAAAGSAATAFAALERAEPRNPVILAYTGSLLLLESSRAFAPWKKGKLAKEGLKRMDAAVTADPDNLEVRFVRAASTRELPGFFKRAAESKSDFALIAPKAASAVRSGRLEARLGSAALYQHAMNLQQDGKQEAARQACKTAIEVAPDTPGAKACEGRFPAG